MGHTSCWKRIVHSISRRSPGHDARGPLGYPDVGMYDGSRADYGTVPDADVEL